MPTPIKICFVSLYAYHFFNTESKSKFGGAELQLYLLATELANDPEFEVFFVVGDFGQSETETRKKVKLYKFFNPKGGLKYFRALGGFIRLWGLLNRINPDVCVQRAAGLETAEVGFYCGLTHRHFVYMVAHDSDINKKKPYWHQGLIGLCKWWLFRLGLKSAELVFTQHELQNKELKSNHRNMMSVVRPSAHMIPGSVDLSEKKFVLWVARCEDWKNPEIYLNLAENIPNQQFVMIMPPSNDMEYYQVIKNRASAMKNLQLIDYVEFDQIDEYFAKALVFVNTSKTEGFPNTFIQAFKNKTPVLSFRVNPNNILTDSSRGMIADGNYDKFKHQLELVLDDNNLRTEMGENAYRYANEHHNLKTIVQSDKEIIKSIVNR